MAGILEGIKVLDMGHVVAVPAACAMMGDWGAEVIKIEPHAGDMLRGLKRMVVENGAIKIYETWPLWYINLLNRNKRGLALDIKKDEGRAILYRLVERADVFLSNYETGALKNLKCDYATLSQINPRLVYGVLTGYGTVGPDKDERGFDFTAGWARTGIQYIIGEPGTPPPPQRGGMIDRVASGFMVAAIMAALLKRTETGRGQELAFSLYHTGVWVLADDIQAALSGFPVLKHERTKPGSPLWSNYQAKDGRWFQLAMLQSDLQWPGFCRAINRPDLENDPRCNSMEMRMLHSEEIVRIIDDILIIKTRTEWEKIFRENGVIYGRIETPEEVVRDPQAEVNNFFADIHIPAVGEGKLVTTPVKFNQYPTSIRMPAPEIGEHTEEILLELDYGWEDIARFKEHGVIL
jgi:crotonobetainyl-CoA:carnitine CoA-transferase CaiB-like acyl-CoA transferase